jgi:hypothetical protein
MLTEKLPTKRLLAFGEMVQIGAVVTRTGGARTIRVQRFQRVFVNSSAELQEAARSEATPPLGQLGGDNAVKHVHSAMHGFQDIQGCADSHEIAGAVLRQQGGGEFAGILALAFYCKMGFEVSFLAGG